MPEPTNTLCPQPTRIGTLGNQPIVPVSELEKVCVSKEEQTAGGVLTSRPGTKVPPSLGRGANDVKASGSAKDLGGTFSVKAGIGVVSGFEARGSGTQIEATYTQPIDDETKLSVSASYATYSGTSGVAGKETPVSGNVIGGRLGISRDVKLGPDVKATFGASAGIEYTNPNGANDKLGLDVTTTQKVEVTLSENDSSKFSAYGDLSEKFNRSDTLGDGEPPSDQFRFKAGTGFAYTDGRYSISAGPSLEVRKPLNGDDRSVQLIPSVAVEGSVEVNDKLTAYAKLGYTFDPGASARTSSTNFFDTSSNPGWFVQAGVRF